MKFKAKMNDISSIQHFSKILSAVGRIAKVAIFRLTSRNIYFILTERSPTGKSHMWCEIPQNHFFYDFQIGGLSEDFNEIYLELTVDYLATAFKSAHMAKAVKIKLSRKFSACLSMEIELPSVYSHSRFVLHDVPVSVIPQRYVDEFQEPPMPQFDVSLYMPSLKVMRNVIDRMKNISTFLVVIASADGKLTLKVETECVTISTHFDELEVNNGPGSEEAHEGSVTCAEARIDIRRVSQFLYGQIVNPDRVICNIVHHKLIQFFLLHDDVSLQFSLPYVAE